MFDELLRQVKKGVDKDSTLRREILDGLSEDERSTDELLRQVKKQGVDVNSILRREILDGLYEYERSDELLQQVKKHRRS